MARKEFWVGSVGPLLYDDAETYPDSVDRVAFRGAQAYLDEAPVEDSHVLRKSDMPSFDTGTAEQGDIWYFDGSQWTMLHHGTSGQVLTTNGHGANPSWTTLALERDGWKSDTDTWVYVSATSFKIEGKDVTARFPVGCKIKLTQTSAKYFYVVGAAFSTDTTVTVTGGSDYSLASAAITSPCYSYQSCPQGFPQWFNYAETWTGFTVGNSPTGGVCIFRIDGREVCLNVNRITPGVSADNTCTVSLPVAATALANYVAYNFGITHDNSAYLDYPGYSSIGTSATTATLRPTVTDTTWTTSNNKNWRGYLRYAI